MMVQSVLYVNPVTGKDALVGSAVAPFKTLIGYGGGFLGGFWEQTFYPQQNWRRIERMTSLDQLGRSFPPVLFLMRGEGVRGREGEREILTGGLFPPRWFSAWAFFTMLSEGKAVALPVTKESARL